MRITKFKLKNYVSFYDENAEDVELGPGINFIVGKNNSGKTKLLDALCLDPSGRPRDSARPWAFQSASVPTAGDAKNQVRVDLLYQFAETEITSVLDKHSLADNIFEKRREFWLPLPSRYSANEDQVRTAIDDFLNKGLGIRYLYIGNESFEEKVETFNDSRPKSRNDKIQAVSYRVEDRICTPLRVQSVEVPFYTVEQSYFHFREYIAANIYRFDADRRIGVRAPTSQCLRLEPDASNLAQVLNSLNGSYPSKFAEYLRTVKSFDRSVQRILFEYPEDKVKVKIDFLDSNPEEPERAIPLDKCGTGLGQVMAMLYVILFYDKSQPRVIIIDEPNSFLHPGAVRKLLEIFQEHDHHQYVIATHSPTAIMSVQKKRILLVTRENKVSKVKSVNVTDNDELEAILKEVGSSRSDIFGMDAYIWVEGPTDVACFNLIMGDRLPPGVQILQLVNPDDLKRSKDSALVEKIYVRLSGGVGILPSALAFIFDGDKRPDDDADNANGRTRYLNRQNYESYFLDYRGISEILSELINNEGGQSPPQPCTAETVQNWIDDNKVKDKFYPEGLQYDVNSWLDHINAAKFLSAMFRALAHPTRKYKKVKDGEEITRRILEKDEDHFQEIVKLFNCILD